MRKSRAISIVCQTDMTYTCPRIMYKDQLPTGKVTANYSEKKPGMGRRIQFMYQLHKTEMFPQTKPPFLDSEHPLYCGQGWGTD